MCGDDGGRPQMPTRKLLKSSVFRSHDDIYIIAHSDVNRVEVKRFINREAIRINIYGVPHAA